MNAIEGFEDITIPEACADIVKDLARTQSSDFRNLQFGGGNVLVIELLKGEREHHLLAPVTVEDFMKLMGLTKTSGMRSIYQVVRFLEVSKTSLAKVLEHYRLAVATEQTVPEDKNVTE